MLDKLISSLETKHRENEIASESYQKWKDNSVTRRLMEELELNLMTVLSEDYIRADVNEMALQACSRQAIKETCESILSWKPQELLSDDD